MITLVKLEDKGVITQSVSVQRYIFVVFIDPYHSGSGRHSRAFIGT